MAKSNVNLTQKQKEIVKSSATHQLIQAVPGAGKSTVLIERANYLISDCGIAPEKLLILSFSNTAVNELHLKYSNLVLNEDKKPSFRTMHSFCLNLIRKYYRRKLVELKVIDDKKGEISKKTILSAIYLNVTGSHLTDEKFGTISLNISYIKNTMMVDDDEFKLKFGSSYCVVKKIYESYEKFKKKRNLIDYDDMLSMCLDVLREDVEYREYVRSYFDYILLDECQDTSKLQYEILFLLIDESKGFFVIGDENQNLYSWRGTSNGLITEFKDKYRDCNVYLMNESFRLPKKIATATNNFFSKNVKIETPFDFDGEIELFELCDDGLEMDLIMGSIMDLDENENLAVLYRNNLSGLYLSYCLFKQGVEFSLSGKLYTLGSNWLVRDIKNFLKVALDLNDIESFKGIYYKFKSFVKKDEIESVTLCEEGNLFQEIAVAIENKKRKITFLNMQKYFLDLRTLSPCDAIDYIESVLGYKDYVGKVAYERGTAISTVKKMMQILRLISREYSDIQSFLNGLDEFDRFLEARLNGQSNFGVILSTIHSVKGMEFDNVYIIDLMEGIFPNIESVNRDNKGDSSGISEEEKIFYVGMTRAKKRLYLCTIQERIGEEYQKSRFFEKMEKVLLD